MLPLLPILAAANTAASQAAASPLSPHGSAWILTFLTLILWLFIAAILLGPLIRRFQIEPTSNQYFSDDLSSSRRR